MQRLALLLALLGIAVASCSEGRGPTRPSGASLWMHLPQLPPSGPKSLLPGSAGPSS